MDYKLNEQKVKHLLAVFVTDYLRDHHLTQQDFATLTGLSINTIKNFLNEKVLPTVDIIYSLSMTLNVDMISILGLPSDHKIPQNEKEQLLKRIDLIQSKLDEIRNDITNDN